MGQFSLRAPRSKFLSSGFPIIGVVWALVARFAFTGNLFFGLFCGGLGLLASALVFLLQHWSVWISSALNTSSATIDTATQVENSFFASCSKSFTPALQVLVYPPPHKGTPGFATLVRDTHGVHFQYQQKKFIWRDNTFSKLDFPVSLTFGHYRNSKGVESAEALGQLQSKFGANSVDLPAPQFKDLYKEHALAPFFVLQIFFILLWCLDEYWMYAILTGIMLALMVLGPIFRRVFLPF